MKTNMNTKIVRLKLTEFLSFCRYSEVELVEETGAALLEPRHQLVEGVVDLVVQVLLLVAEGLAGRADSLDALPDARDLVLDAGEGPPHVPRLLLHGALQAAHGRVIVYVCVMMTWPGAGSYH